jgi:hypothetical protein
MPTREDFEIALALACEDFGKRDPVLQAERAGVAWKTEPGGKGGHADIPFLRTSYRVRGPSGEVSYRDEQAKEPALWEQILVLHYLTTADGSPLEGERISFKEVREAMLYLPNFEKRAVAPLLGRFGGIPEQILTPAERLGGKREALGDLSVTIPVFPRVPITLVFWRRDDEFEARLSILFDRTVVRYLPTEDIVLAAQMMAYRLIGMA